MIEGPTRTDPSQVFATSDLPARPMSRHLLLPVLVLLALPAIGSARACPRGAESEVSKEEWQEIEDFFARHAQLFNDRKIDQLMACYDPHFYSEAYHFGLNRVLLEKVYRDAIE